MRTLARTLRPQVRDKYPAADGRPMAETDLHRLLIVDLIDSLDAFYNADPMVYVSGNLLLFYVPGDRRRHVSPDVFVVKGVPKQRRRNFLVWEEGKGPDAVFEITSASTREEDEDDKFWLYQDTLRVPEYFLFDPLGEYLNPPLKGYRLRDGKYIPIRPVRGRLPSRVLGLHLERSGSELRLFDPTSKKWLPTLRERIVQAEKAQQVVEQENARLKKQLDDLRRRLTNGR